MHEAGDANIDGDIDGCGEVARAESERGELVLRRRRDPDGARVLELRANGSFVMDTRETSSERALATVALARVAAPREVLIGGLGLGFTAAAVLADPRVERVTVVEIEPALVTWLRDGLVPHGPALLADERLVVVVGDVADALDGAAAYDLVLLDVDNGPDQLVHAANAAIYGSESLARSSRLLHPGGVLAVWSAHAAPALEASLREHLDAVEVVDVDVDLQGRAERYHVVLGRRAGLSRPG